MDLCAKIISRRTRTDSVSSLKASGLRDWADSLVEVLQMFVYRAFGLYFKAFWPTYKCSKKAAIDNDYQVMEHLYWGLAENEEAREAQGARMLRLAATSSTGPSHGVPPSTSRQRRRRVVLDLAGLLSFVVIGTLRAPTRVTSASAVANVVSRASPQVSLLPSGASRPARGRQHHDLRIQQQAHDASLIVRAHLLPSLHCSLHHEHLLCSELVLPSLSSSKVGLRTHATGWETSTVRIPDPLFSLHCIR